MKNFIYTLGFVAMCSLVFTMCNAQAGSKEVSSTEKKIPTGPLAEKLYSNYTDNPQSQAQIDQNKIIDYAFSKDMYVVKSNSGLYYKIVKSTDEPNIQRGQTITAHYKGVTLDGKQFDSSYDRDQPINFQIGQVIQGWNEGLLLMNKGAKAELIIPSQLAYGTGGYGDLIGPNEPLHFQMEIIDVR